jgi:hypothetical protein
MRKFKPAWTNVTMATKSIVTLAATTVEPTAARV